MLNLRHEQMGPHFDKWHVEGTPFDASIHHLFPDTGDPHDHPFYFTSYVLHGWLIEERYDENMDIYIRFQHLAGTHYSMAAETVHKIVEVSEGGCWTIITPGPYVNKPRFYRHDGNRVLSRAWDETEFK